MEAATYPGFAEVVKNVSSVNLNRRENAISKLNTKVNENKREKKQLSCSKRAQILSYDSVQSFTCKVQKTSTSPVRTFLALYSILKANRLF